MSASTQLIERNSPWAIRGWRAQVTQARLAVVGLFVFVAAYNFYTLLLSPVVFVDEGWNASRTWGLLHTGHAFGTLDAGVFDKYDGYWTYFPWLGTALHAPTMFLFGPSLFAIRLASLLFGLVLLAAVYAIGNRLYGRRMGFLAALALALSSPFGLSSHLARHDIMLAAFGFGAVALYLTDDARGFPIKSVLSGLAVGLLPDIHPSGIIFGPVLVALYLFDRRLLLFRDKRFWGFLAGAAAGVAYYVVIHLLLYPQTYSALARLGGIWYTPPLLTWDPAVWLDSLRDTISYFRWLLPVAAVALAVLLFRRTDSDKRLLVLFTALILIYASVVRRKPPWYEILYVPAAWLLVAALLDKVSRERWNASLVACARTASVLGLVAVAAMPNLTPVNFGPPPCPAVAPRSSSGLGNPAQEFEYTIDRVRRAVPSGSSIMGHQVYWFALPNERYLSWEQTLYYRRNAPGTTLADAFNALRPGYFILDSWLESLTKNCNSPESALDRVLATNGHLVDAFDTDTLGKIRIYRMDWSGSGSAQEGSVSGAAPGRKELRP